MLLDFDRTHQVAFGGFDAQLTTASVRAGAVLHSIQLPDTLHSVSTDRSGSVFAAGCDNGIVYCFNIEAGSSEGISQLAWSEQHKAKVWVVAVSPDGSFVAAGDYANVVRVYAAVDGAVVWEKKSWNGGPPVCAIAAAVFVCLYRLFDCVWVLPLSPHSLPGDSLGRAIATHL
jgi:WD40 repeat protein